MKLPFFKKKEATPKPQSSPQAPVREVVARRLDSIKRGEKNENLAKHEIPDLVKGLADGDG